MHLLLRSLENSGKHRDRGDVSEAGELPQRLLRFKRQPGHPVNQKVHHIIGVTLAANAIEIPRPARRIMIEVEQALFGERVKKLNDEERIAGGLLLYQLRQRRDMGRIAAKRIRDQLLEVVTGERFQVDLLNQSSGLADRIELASQRMHGVALVVQISADQHQVLQIRPDQQILQQIESRSIEPLQIVEKERQRMFRPGKHTNESAEHKLETVLRLLRVEFRDRRRVIDNEFQFWDEVGHKPCVWDQRLQKRIAPDRQFGIALAKKRTHQALKSLHQGRIRNVALILIELARSE